MTIRQCFEIISREGDFSLRFAPEGDGSISLELELWNVNPQEREMERIYRLGKLELIETKMLGEKLSLFRRHALIEETHRGRKKEDQALDPVEEHIRKVAEQKGEGNE